MQMKMYKLTLEQQQPYDLNKCNDELQDATHVETYIDNHKTLVIFAFYPDEKDKRHICNICGGDMILDGNVLRCVKWGDHRA